MANDKYYGYSPKKETRKPSTGVTDVGTRLDRVNPYEFRKGMDVELTSLGVSRLAESTPEEREKATESVLKNLEEHQAYYSALIQFERGMDQASPINETSFKKYLEAYNGSEGRGDGMVEVDKEIKNDNATGEYYLTDIVSIINKKGFKIKTCIVSNEEVKGANTKKELSELEETFRKMKSEDLLEMGITVSDPNRVDVRGEVSAGTDCIIDVNVILDGVVKLGDNVSIGPNTILKDVEIGNNTSIEAFSHLVSSKVGKDCIIGPYARLREGSQIDDSAKVGNFVETKKTTLGKGSKANHFAYLGDAEIGSGSNIGAGTITCNYDGKDKHQTKIGDDSFVGTNSSLVAPVTVGSNAYVAAGSVITKDVPDNALGVGRSKQTNVEDWSKNKD